MRSICTAVTKVVDLSALEHLTGLDVCEDSTAITLGLLRLYVEESEKSKCMLNVCNTAQSILPHAGNKA